MDKVIDLESFRKSKEKEKESRTTGIKQAMRDSLDNEEVKRRYRIESKDKPPVPLEQRMENIRASVRRINSIMAELKEKTDDKTKI